ncbi:maleylpyruvate isomerase family mycothiol-dependent enzyme [soil metagenome]
MTNRRLADLSVISAAAVAEASIADPVATLDCAGWPVAERLIEHLGSHFGWVVSAIGTIERPPSGPGRPVEAPLVEWFASERDRFIETLLRLPEDTPSWTLSGPGTVAFWHRRSTFEVARHVWDLRTAGGVRPLAPPELSAESYADGVSEHFDLFLARSRPGLDPLPGTLKLIASDTEASWLLSPDWSRPDQGEADAVIEGPAGELALLCWERADALVHPKLTVSGSVEVVRAFQVAPIHR